MSYTVRYKLHRDEQKIAQIMLANKIDPARLSKELLIQWYFTKVEEAKKLAAEKKVEEQQQKESTDGSGEKNESVITVEASELPALHSGGAAE